jgi:Temperature dependent protein affecting M2 dsRNA replication
MFPMYTGQPYSEDETVNRNTLLIARVASLARFSHQEIGYTGPLSRHFLGYHSMATAVRESIRDLAEVCLVNLLFNGDAVRTREDYGDLGFE